MVSAVVVSRQSSAVSHRRRRRPLPLDGSAGQNLRVNDQHPVGLVLAGGSSTRMGRDKAMLEVGGVSLIGRAARTLAACCREVLVADGGRGALAGYTSVADGAGRGPAAGILGGAAAAPGRHLLVLACDLPLVPASLLELLTSESGRADWVVPGHRGLLEPLCALYGPRSLAALAEQVESGVLGPHRLAEIANLEVCYLDESTLVALGDPGTMFANVNRPEDLRHVEALLEID